MNEDGAAAHHPPHPGPPPRQRRSRYRTGDRAIDTAIETLVGAADVGDSEDLITEMVVSAIRLGRQSADRAELKLVNAALKELRYAFSVFDPYEDVPKVSVFGSARTRHDDPAYDTARRFAREMAAAGWMIVSGAGPGIMTAAVEGAGADRAFGVNIVLPFEAEATPLLVGDPKLVNFRYFFTRKVAFMKESKAFALLPGGFGTMDEAFELLTLLQTGRTHPAPVVLLEEPGGSYWQGWLDFTSEHLHGRGLIADDDLCLVRVCSTVDEAVAEVLGFYATYHSMRFVGRRLVLRLRRAVTDAELDALNDEFGDLVVSGAIERIRATEPERVDGDVPDLSRLALHFDRASYARLRRLIDRVNQGSGAIPPAVGRAPFLDAVDQAGDAASQPPASPDPPSPS